MKKTKIFRVSARYEYAIGTVGTIFTVTADRIPSPNEESALAEFYAALVNLPCMKVDLSSLTIDPVQ